MPLLGCLSWPFEPRSLSDFSKVLDERTLEESKAFLYSVGQANPSPRQAATQAQKWADLARERGELARAIALYAEACQQFQSSGMNKQQADCTTRLADMYLHLGDAAHAQSRYEDAQTIRDGRAGRRETDGGEEFYFTLYHDGIFFAELGDIDKARKKLRGARAAAAKPTYQLGVQSTDHSLQQAALDELRSMWSGEKQRGIRAHDFLEMLLECIDHDPQRADLRAQAFEVLAEITRRLQWQGDVHVERWRKRLSAIKVAQNGVLAK